jgi:orotate phosphoribosyltransferase
MTEVAIAKLRSQLAALLKKEALRRGRFVLSSGKTSDYYLDGRVITLMPEGAYLAASIVLDYVQANKINAVGGPTLGADPIAGAVAALAFQNNIPLKTFIVRKASKGHGTQRRIEGPALEAGDSVLLLDDVATTGKAILEAKEALEEIGIKTDRALVIVDRQEGASQNLAAAGIKLEAIFTIRELLNA